MYFANDRGELFEVEREFDQDEQEQASILRAFLGTVKHYFGGFKQLLGGVNDARNQVRQKHAHYENEQGRDDIRNVSKQSLKNI